MLPGLVALKRGGVEGDCGALLMGCAGSGAGEEEDFCWRGGGGSARGGGWFVCFAQL